MAPDGFFRIAAAARLVPAEPADERGQGHPVGSISSSRPSAPSLPRRPGEATEAAFVLIVHLRLTTLQDRALGYEDEVEAGRNLGPSERLPQEPLRAVAGHGTPHPTAGREPEPRAVAFGGSRPEGEERPVHSHPKAHHSPELGAPAQPGLLGEARARPAQTLRRLRPRARRRFSTRRPPLVRILTRKPWVRFRFRLFGWNVLFIRHLASTPEDPLPRQGGVTDAGAKAPV